MSKSADFLKEVRERAVRLVLEQQANRPGIPGAVQINVYRVV